MSEQEQIQETSSQLTSLHGMVWTDESCPAPEPGAIITLNGLCTKMLHVGVQDYQVFWFLQKPKVLFIQNVSRFIC